MFGSKKLIIIPVAKRTSLRYLVNINFNTDSLKLLILLGLIFTILFLILWLKILYQNDLNLVRGGLFHSENNSEILCSECYFQYHKIGILVKKIDSCKKKIKFFSFTDSITIMSEISSFLGVKSDLF